MVRQSVVAGFLAISMMGQAQQGSLPEAQQQGAVPDAPRPQNSLPTYGTVTPGQGAPPPGAQPAVPSQPGPPDDFQKTAPGSSLPAGQANGTPTDSEAPPDLPATGQGTDAVTTFNTRTNFVEVPFTVKDSKNQLVPGITWREVRIYENNLRQHMSVWTADAAPLSVALVIDQSVTFDEMTRINNSLAALQGAFTPYDEVAVFTYNNGPRLRTEFTAAQSARLSAVLEQSKTTGRDPIFYSSGALSQNINLNNGSLMNTMPLTNTNHGTTQSNTINVPREVHTLNDAVLEAAKTLTHAAKGRRRIIYVITDGREYGSTAKTKDVIKYLQTNRIAVYGTLVHSFPNIKGEGFLDRIHLPLQMRDNLLPVYTEATGGQVDAEFRQRGIEQSFARIAEQVRNQYTIGYYSHEPMIDGKYRTIEVKVLRPNLTVIAKKGYYPTAMDATQHPAAQTAAQ